MCALLCGASSGPARADDDTTIRPGARGDPAPPVARGASGGVIELAIAKVRPPGPDDAEPLLAGPPGPVLVGGVATFLQSILEIESIPLGRVVLGHASSSLRLEGAILVAQDFPSLGSFARLRVLDREVRVALPALQVVPRLEGGRMLVVEIKLLLVDRRF